MAEEEVQVESIEEFGTEIDARKAMLGKQSPDVPELGNPTAGENGNSRNYTQWTFLGNGIWGPAGSTRQKLNSHAYTVFRNDHGTFLQEENVSSDDLIEFKDSITDQILAEIELFWDSKEKFKKYGFLHRRGYIFYGDAGCGKSGMIYMIINKVIARKGVVLICNNRPELWVEGVKLIRMIEPDRHIVTILEDIDAIIEKHGEEQVLSFLDGESQNDDILNIATTNYCGRLDRRIISRPRRFDKRIKIWPPSDSMRKEFFMKKMNISEEEVEEWVRVSKGFSFAGLADLVIQVKCLQVPLEKAVKILKDLMGSIPSSSDDNNKVGFGG